MFTGILRFNSENIIFVALNPDTKELNAVVLDERNNEVYEYTIALDEGE